LQNKGRFSEAFPAISSLDIWQITAAVAVVVICCFCIIFHQARLYDVPVQYGPIWHNGTAGKTQIVCGHLGLLLQDLGGSVRFS